jgi:hypothetical protein
MIILTAANARGLHQRAFAAVGGPCDRARSGPERSWAASEGSADPAT